MTGALSADDGDLSALVGRIADEFLNDNSGEARRLLHQLAADQPSAAAAVGATVPLLRLLAQSPLDASCEQPAAVRLGDFQLLRPIAQGGMGVVYEARQLSLGRRVAVKVLTLAGTLDQRRLRRFQVEARAASLLTHPHVVPVYAVGFDEGVHYYAMQFVDGHSLADPAVWRRLAPDGALAPRVRIEQIVRLGIQAADALHYSHSEGVVHRDVKPSNLLVDASGHLWVADFGLAHMQAEPGCTATGDLLGTLCYMSPEQLQAAALVDHRTDVYSLGVTLYELLAERPAFGGGEREFVLRSILGAQLEPLRRVRPEIPRDLETVVRRATAADRDQRYPTAAALAEDLRRIRDGRPIVAQRPSRWRGFRYWVQRNRLPAALSAGLLATVLMLAVGGPLAAWRQRRLTAEAHTQLHISEMNLAYQAWNSGHVDRAAELLARREARPLYGDSRDFPLRHLRNLLQAAQQSVLYQHEGRLNDVVVSPDGRLMAYCGGETGVRVLDARSHEVIASLGEPERLIGSLAFADDGATLVANHKDPGIILYNCADWTQREAELPLKASVRVLQASPSAALFAVGSFGGEVAVCGDDGRCLWTAQAAAGQIWGIAFSPDEAQIVTVSDDHSVKLWSTHSGELLKDLPRLRSSAYDVAWSDEGTRVFIACGEGMRCFDVASGALLEGLADDLGSTAAVAVHGNLLATGGYDHTVALWSVDSGACLGKFTAHRQEVTSLAVSRDGRRLWSAGGDGDLRTWDLARFESAAALATQTDKPWYCGLDVAADGDFAISIGTRYGAGEPIDDAQGSLVVWDAHRGTALRSMEVEPRFGFDVSVSDDLGVCASAGLGGVRLWKVDDLSPICDLHRNDQHEFCTVATSPDGRWLAAGGRDRPQSYEQSAIVLLWDLRSSSPAPQRLALSNLAGEVFSLAFSHDGRRLAIARGNWDRGSVAVWSLDGDAWRESDGALTTHEHMAWDVTFFSDSLSLASTGSGGEVAIGSCGASQRKLDVLTASGFSIAASPDNALIALGSNGQICLWDRVAEQQLAVIPINSWANGLAFTPDGEALVWTGGDGSVHWELNVRPLPAD